MSATVSAMLPLFAVLLGLGDGKEDERHPERQQEEQQEMHAARMPQQRC